MPYGILMLAIVGLTMLAVPVRVALVLALSLSAAACGGYDQSTAPTPPTAPFSTTDLREGTGTTATQGRTVTVSYTGWIFDPSRPELKGTQFDSQASFTFQLGGGRVIPGWEQGIPGMKVGGQRRLIIPPNLGYGSQMAGSIPPNSTLVFDVMLLSVL